MYERKSKHTISEVLSHIPDLDIPEKIRKKIKVDFNGDLVKMASQRYIVFSQSLSCAHCNLKASFFAKERHVNKKGIPCTPNYHFNLYAIDDNNNEVLFTKDHIIPKSKGGKDIIENYQTMCQTCNTLKADSHESSR